MGRINHYKRQGAMMTLNNYLKCLLPALLLLTLSACNTIIIPEDNGYRPPTQSAMPAGNYSQSCDLCNMRGDTLSCLCKDRQGIVNQTSIAGASQCRFVQNMNGNLRCGRHHRRARLPRGNYKRTCVDCSIRHNALSCSCAISFSRCITCACCCRWL